jgi:hypothetical protein
MSSGHGAGFEVSVGLAADVSLEAALDLAVALALDASAVGMDAGGRVVA